MVSLFCCLHVFSNPPPTITPPLPRHCYTSPHLQHTNRHFSHSFCSGLGRAPSHVTSCFVPHALSSPPCPRRSWIRRHHRIYKLCFFCSVGGLTLRSQRTVRASALGNVTVFPSIRIFFLFLPEKLRTKTKKDGLFGDIMDLCRSFMPFCFGVRSCESWRVSFNSKESRVNHTRAKINRLCADQDFDSASRPHSPPASTNKPQNSQDSET